MKQTRWDGNWLAHIYKMADEMEERAVVISALTKVESQIERTHTGRYRFLSMKFVGTACYLSQ